MGAVTPRRVKPIDLGTDNLFEELGASHPEERLLVATLASRIRAVVQDRGLTCIEAGYVMGLPQPEVSELLEGGGAGLAAERLIGLLNRLGVSVQIAFVEEPRWAPGETVFAWDRPSDAEVADEADSSDRTETADALASGSR